MQNSHDKRYRLKDIVKSSRYYFPDEYPCLTLRNNKPKRLLSPEDLPYREKKYYRPKVSLDYQNLTFQNKVTGILKKCIGMKYEDAWQLVKQKLPNHLPLQDFIRKNYKLPSKAFYVDNEGVLQKHNQN